MKLRRSVVPGWLLPASAVFCSTVWSCFSSSRPAFLDIEVLSPFQGFAGGRVGRIHSMTGAAGS